MDWRSLIFISELFGAIALFLLVRLWKISSLLLWNGGAPRKEASFSELENLVSMDVEDSSALEYDSNDSDSDKCSQEYHNHQHGRQESRKIEISVHYSAILCIMLLCSLLGLSHIYTIDPNTNTMLGVLVGCTWACFFIICVLCNFTITELQGTQKNSYLYTLLRLVHAGKERKIPDGSNIATIQYRFSSSILHCFLLFWISQIFFFSLFESIGEFNEALETQFSEKIPISVYILAVESTLSFLILIILISNFFAYSKLFYGVGQSGETLKFLEEIENTVLRNDFQDESIDENDDDDDDETKNEERGFIKDAIRLMVEIAPEMGYILPAFLFVMLEAICAIAVSMVIGLSISVFTPNVNGTYGLSLYGSEAYDAEDSSFKEDQFYILLRMIGILIFIMAVQCISSGITNTLTEVARERMANRVRSKAFFSLLAQELGHFDKCMAGDIWSRLTNDTNEMTRVIDSIGMILYCLIVSIIGVIVLFLISWKLTASLLVLVPLLGIVVFFQSTIVSKLTTKKLNLLAKAGEAAEEILANVKIVKSSSTERQESLRYGIRVFESFRIAKKLAVVDGLADSSIFFLLNIGCVIALLTAGYLVLSEEISTAQVVIYLLFVIDVMIYFAMVPGYISEISKAIGASGSLLGILDRESQQGGAGGEEEEGEESGSFAGQDIVFHDVSFQYPTRKQVILEDVSLTVPANSTIGILGPSGSGKSTVFSLLMRFYEPTSGYITIGDRKLGDCNIEKIRSNIALVLQDPMLFTDTIANNIAYGFSFKDNERVKEAAMMANAHEFIMELPKGYDTVVSKSTLSGGQRQRISIARALYKDANVLLLDEFTSGLDGVNENSVVSTLNDVTQNKTVFIISHSEAPVTHADRVLILKDKKLIPRETEEVKVQ